MGSGTGHIELDRQVASIRVGHRHRRDLGDLDALAASIKRLGLLQPITISPDGVLICGARRLAAVKLLGLQRINVWVRSGLSTPVQRLLAEQEDNGQHKPLTPTEAAALYGELKLLLAEDAARRKEASRFGSARPAGPADSAGPQPDTRVAAARLVTGTSGYTRLEQVTHLQQLTADPGQPDAVRRQATDALEAIDRTGKVNGPYQRVRAALEQRHTHPADPDPGTRTDEPSQDQDRPANDAQPACGGTRRFQLLLADLACWTDRFDPTRIGPALPDDQWSTFEATVQATVEFLHTARVARNPGTHATAAAPATAGDRGQRAAREAAA